MRQEKGITLLESLLSISFFSVLILSLMHQLVTLNRLGCAQKERYVAKTFLQAISFEPLSTLPSELEQIFKETLSDYHLKRSAKEVELSWRTCKPHQQSTRTRLSL